MKSRGYYHLLTENNSKLDNHLINWKRKLVLRKPKLKGEHWRVFPLTHIPENLKISLLKEA